jgi:hypothetical protein
VAGVRGHDSGRRQGAVRALDAAAAGWVLDDYGRRLGRLAIAHAARHVASAPPAGGVVSYSLFALWV